MGFVVVVLLMGVGRGRDESLSVLTVEASMDPNDYDYENGCDYDCDCDTLPTRRVDLNAEVVTCILAVGVVACRTGRVVVRRVVVNTYGYSDRQTVMTFLLLVLRSSKWVIHPPVPQFLMQRRSLVVLRRYGLLPRRALLVYNDIRMWRMFRNYMADMSIYNNPHQPKTITGDNTLPNRYNLPTLPQNQL